VQKHASLKKMFHSQKHLLGAFKILN